jgi:hypothetical protein
MYPRVQITKSGFEIDLVGLPRQTIDAGRCITLQLEEGSSQKIGRDVVHERSELLRLLLPCHLSDTFQRM